MSGEAERLFNEWLEQRIREHQEQKAAMAKRTPAQEVEALLESLKTETGFVKPVKWGK